MSTQHNCQIWLKLTVTTRLEFSSAVLQWMFSNACKNADIYQSNEARWSYQKVFYMYVFFMSDPAAYEMLHQKLPEALPSLSLVKKEMKKMLQ